VNLNDSTSEDGFDDDGNEIEGGEEEEDVCICYDSTRNKSESHEVEMVGSGHKYIDSTSSRDT